jgi:hypothetical protein
MMPLDEAGSAFPDHEFLERRTPAAPNISISCLLVVDQDHLVRRARFPTAVYGISTSAWLMRSWRGEPMAGIRKKKTDK